MTSFRLGLRARAAGALLVGGLLAGCPGDDTTTDSGDDMTTMPATTMPSDETGTPSVSHAADIQPIWDEHCVTMCHEPGGMGEAWLDLSSGVAYGEIVDVMALTLPSLDYVEPGDTNMSYLWHKIQGSQATVGGGGVNMPSPLPGMEATVLTPAQFDTIEAWINAGAPE